jgi:DNA polymerase III alpha subunit
LITALSHLHVRSGFSYGFGTSTPEELVEAAECMGADSVALTDRDGLYGIPRFLRAAGEADIRPIVGVEVNVDVGGRLVLLAEDAKGYRSLSKLVTFYRCSSENRRKPLCSLPALLDHAQGLVCLTGAVPFGLLPRLVLSDDGRKAKEVLDDLLEAFGRNNVFAELTDDGIMGSRRRLGRFTLFAEERGVPVLATNEVAYLRPEDHRFHEALVAAANLARLPDRRTAPPISSTSKRRRRCGVSSETTPRL